MRPPANCLLSTRGVAPERRPAAIRELNRKNLVLHLEPLAGRPLAAEVAVHGGPALRVMSAAFAGLAHGAPAERRAADPSDDLFLGITVAGESRARQRGREIALGGGDAVLLARGEDGFTVCHPGEVGFLGLRIPRAALAPLVPRLDDAVAVRLAAQAPGLRLLRAYLAELVAGELLAAPEAGRLAARHVHDLVALALGAAREAAATAVRAARLRAIQADLLARLTEPGLSPTAVAARHGITARYLHKLFAPTGTTFAAFLLAARLDHARRLLGDPLHAHRSIAAIAYAAGFADLSHFNRSFRRRFATTPRACRAT